MQQSSIIKNGQQLYVSAGTKAIARGDLTLIGGPGNLAWTAACADYASQAGAVAIRNEVQVVNAALPGMTRQPIARDRLGNIFIAGTNSSGNLVIYKYSANGIPVNSLIADATATSVNSAAMFQLSSGAFAVVYARASGALYFVIVDSGLALIAGPISVATERSSTNVVYHAACALNGGGFAIVYQTSGGTAINLTTYSNLGVSVLGATSIQSLGGSIAQVWLAIGQLSSGALVVAFRGSMTATGVAGTSFLLVSTGGSVAYGPSNIDTTATLGMVRVSILAGYFALATANGTSLIAGVFSNAGAQQGSTYTTGDTYNQTTFPQFKIENDGVGFWLVWAGSTNNGINVVGLSVAGVSGTALTAVGSSVITAATSALDAEVINNLLVVLVASTGTDGQFYITIALPNSSLGMLAPSLRFGPVAFGSAAGTTGSSWPRVLSGGGGLYTGSSAPQAQPTNVPATCGDFTAIFLYDRGNTAGTFIGIQKVEASAIVGVALGVANANSPGTALLINPGPGEYPSNTIGGAPGTPFSHLVASPAGTSGIIFTNGIGASGLSSSNIGSSSIPPGSLFGFAGSTAPSGYLLCAGQAVSRAVFAALFAEIGTTYGSGDGSSTFNVPDARGRVIVGIDNMNGSAAGRITSATMTPNGTTLGAVGGAQQVTLTAAEQASMTVSGTCSATGYTDQPTTVNTSGQGAAFGHIFSGQGQTVYAAQPNVTVSGSISGTAAGGGGAHLNLQPSIAANIIIKF